MPVLEFIFSSFWHWLGAAILLAIVVEGVGLLFRRKR